MADQEQNGETPPPPPPQAEHSPTGPSSIVELDPQVDAVIDRLINEAVCTAKDIDDNIRSQLKVLKPSDAIEALSKLESALKTSNIRSLPAYLAGVIRRITQLALNDADSNLPLLVHEAQSTLDYLYSRNLVRRGDLDYKTLSKIVEKPPEFQVLIMDTFRERNLHGIRNMGGFFTTHVKQIEQDLRDGKLRLPRLGPPPRRGGGHHDHHPDYHRGPPPPYSDRERRGPPPAYNEVPYHHHVHGAPPPYGSTAPPPYAQQQPPPYAVPAAAAPPQPLPYSSVPPPVATAPAPLPRHYSTEQVQWGIRVDEFQSLSQFAKYVNPAAALRLQQLWDVDQNKLVSVLNEASWEAIAGLDAANGVAAINECAEAMKTAPDDISTINSIFITIAAKFPKRSDAPTLATIALAAAQASGAAPIIPAAAVQPPPLQRQQPAYTAAALPGPGSAYQPPPYSGAPPPAAAPYTSAPPPVQLPGPCGALSPPIQAAIDRVLRQWNGLVKLEHFENKSIDLIYRIGERNALVALEEFGRNDPVNMRSVTAYLIGCLKKYDLDRPPRGGDPGYGGRGGGGRGPPARGRGPSRGRGRGRGPPSGHHHYDPY